MTPCVRTPSGALSGTSSRAGANSTSASTTLHSNMMLTYLELKGFLAGSTPLYRQYRFQPLLTLREMLAYLGRGGRATFFSPLCSARRSGPVLVPYRSRRCRDGTGDRLGTDHPRPGLAGGVADTVGRGHMRYRYRRLRSPADSVALADELHHYGLKREAAELERSGRYWSLQLRTLVRSPPSPPNFTAAGVDRRFRSPGTRLAGDTTKPPGSAEPAGLHHRRYARRALGPSPASCAVSPLPASAGPGWVNIRSRGA